MTCVATRMISPTDESATVAVAPARRPYLLGDRRLSWAEVRALNALRNAAMDAARRHTDDPEELMAAWQRATCEALATLGAAAGGRS